jgi:probable HAF family extracellular repeat protein
MKLLNPTLTNSTDLSLEKRTKQLGNWKSAVCVALLAGATAMPALSAPGAYNFLEVSNPKDPTFTQLLGINNDHTIAGYFGSGADPAHPNKGFTLTLPNSFVDENFPGSIQTQVVGINNRGETGGFYVDGAGTTHGFLDINGTFTNVDAPNTAFNQILGVNDLGVAAGYSSTDPAGATLQQAFIYRHGQFVYVPFNIPNLGNTQATGINDANIVSGFYQTGDQTFGFIWDWRHHHMGKIQYPGANFTQALGVNNAGQVVGVYSKDGEATTHGFVYKEGHYASVDEPNSVNLGATLVNGINDRGQIVGFFTDNNGNTVGFVGNPRKHHFHH